MLGKFSGDGVADVRQLGLYHHAATNRAASKFVQRRGDPVEGHRVVG